MERKINISGMSCLSCETKVKKALLKVEGVSSAQVSYASGTAFVKGKNLPSDAKLKLAIEGAGYKFEKEKFPWGFVGLLTGGIVVFFAAQALYGSLYFDPTSSSVTLGLVVVYGLVSSLHCIGMCGGIAFGTSISSSVMKPGKRARQYQSGRIISYTLSGILLGALGRVFTISPMFTNILLLVAGLWMIFLALNMAKVIRIRMPEIALFKDNVNRAPFFVGLLNALMPCGSLQTMQVVSLGTANPLYGGGIMLVFAITTAPSLIGMQWLGAKMNALNGRRVQLAAALLVALMGLQMTLRSPLIASPVNALMQAISGEKANAPMVDGYQVVNLHLKNGKYIVDYPNIKAGVPVKLSFSWEGITGCTNPVELTFLGVRIDVKKNPEPVVFTPDKKGNLEIICWMHMVHTYLYVN
jgi:sulfite exporter TauE/SafE/copper chaperone CopZ